MEVVGVVPSTFQEGDYEEVWYLPFIQDPTGRSADNFHFMIRARSGEALAGLRGVVASVDPTLAVQRVAGMRTLRSERIESEETGAAVALAFGGVGLLLACLGVYGLLAYQVSLRRREFATCLALGAERRDVLRQVMGQTFRLVLQGGVVGLFLAYGLNLALARVVAGVRTAAPHLALGLAAMLAVAAFAAAVVPALRAASLDPANVLRAE
jgi:predicted lysophospholipase L1 biosynthesis ABC-type transport system permease subunit